MTNLIFFTLDFIREIDGRSTVECPQPFLFVISSLVYMPSHKSMSAFSQNPSKSPSSPKSNSLSRTMTTFFDPFLKLYPKAPARVFKSDVVNNKV